MSKIDPNSPEGQLLYNMLTSLFEDTLNGMLATFAESKQRRQHTGEITGADQAWGQLQQIPQQLWPAFIAELVARIYDLQQQLERKESHG